MPLFTGVRGIGILGSSLAGFWIKPRNTPPRWPWASPIRARGGRYYLRLDAYAGSWMLPAKPLLVRPHPALGLHQCFLDRCVRVLQPLEQDPVLGVCEPVLRVCLGPPQFGGLLHEVVE